MSRTPLTAADAAWLHMDTPTNPMIVSAVIWFSEPVDWLVLRTVIEMRLLGEFPRFRQRVGGAATARPRWRDADDFNLDLHLHLVALASNGNRTRLEDLIGDLISRPLPPDRPLWEAHLIQGVGTGSVVLVRVHHALADGVALVRVLLRVSDASAAARTRGTRLPSALDRLSAPLRRAFRGTCAAVAAVSTREQRHAVARLTADDLAAFAKLLFTRRDARTCLKGRQTAELRVGWTAPWPLSGLAAARAATGATVNDLLVACVAGAVRTYLSERGVHPETVRAMVPFNLRSLDDELDVSLGNKFSLVLLGLPTGIADRMERLEAVKREMDRIKASREPAMSFVILNTLGVMPPAVEGTMIEVFAAKASMVLTNVPGPRDPLRIAGAPVERVLVWAPTSGSISMSVSVITYAGEISAGFMTHAALVPDPQHLAGLFEQEMAQLATLPATVS